MAKKSTIEPQPAPSAWNWDGQRCLDELMEAEAKLSKCLDSMRKLIGKVYACNKLLGFHHPTLDGDSAYTSKIERARQMMGEAREVLATAWIGVVDDVQFMEEEKRKAQEQKGGAK